MFKKYKSYLIINVFYRRNGIKSGGKLFLERRIGPYSVINMGLRGRGGGRREEGGRSKEEEDVWKKNEWGVWMIA